MELAGHFYLSIFLRFLPCWNVIKYSNLINKLNLFRWERLNWTFNIRYFYLFVFSREREKILETPSVLVYRAGQASLSSHLSLPHYTDWASVLTGLSGLSLPALPPSHAQLCSLQEHHYSSHCSLQEHHYSSHCSLQSLCVGRTVGISRELPGHLPVAFTWLEWINNAIYWYRLAPLPLIGLGLGPLSIISHWP